MNHANFTLIDGKKVAAHVRSQVALEVQSFKAKLGRAPQLAVILVGDMKASQVYVHNKETACAEVGFKSLRIDLPASLSQQALELEIQKLNEDPSVDGILVQLPLPNGLSAERVQEVLSPAKDADGFTVGSMGKLLVGKYDVAPCTPAGVIELLKYYKIPIAGKHAVVAGRSLIVGKPMAQLLLAEDATVTICHSKTKDLAQFTRGADIVIAAIGKKHFFGKEHFSAHSVVIDVGIHGTGSVSGSGGGVTGDVRYSEIADFVSAATPVPGGVGPMTIAMLLRNTMILAKKRAGI